MLTNKIVNQHFYVCIQKRALKELLFSIYGDIQKKEFAKNSFFVIPAGFEPTTHSLEGCCSIQLSYETNMFFLCIVISV